MEYRKLKTLAKLENNPRLIKDKEFKTLCDSIRDNPKYFEARPLILSDRTGDLVIIAGNQRYEAAKTLKMDEVPTYLIEGLTEEKEREIIIRDNINNGEFDMDLLSAWDDLPLADWGLELPEEWGNEVDGAEFPELPEGDKQPFQQMTFTLHDTQAEQVGAALKSSKAMGPFIDSDNENSNGNALARICETFLTGHGNS